MPAPCILIVDDDSGDRHHIRRLLDASDLGADVHECATAEDALTFDSCTPNAILLDNHLPFGSGLDIIGGLKRRWPGAAVVLMTGQGSEEIAKQAIQLGACDYLRKSDLGAEVLVRMLRSGIQVEAAHHLDSERQEEARSFANILVHDFRAPLRAIHLIATCVRKDIDHDALDEARTGLRMLEHAATQAIDLIDSLEAHISVGREIALEPADLGALAMRAVTILRPEVEGTGASIRIGPLPRAPLCAPPQVAQLFQNLIGNAIKFCDQHAPVVRIEGQVRQDGFVEITVDDNGPGVSEAFRERMFDPFTRNVSGKVPGTGLGLATCRRIVERHGGTIRCDIAPEGGARVVFTLAPAETVRRQMNHTEIADVASPHVPAGPAASEPHPAQTTASRSAGS